MSGCTDLQMKNDCQFDSALRHAFLLQKQSGAMLRISTFACMHFVLSAVENKTARIRALHLVG